MSTKSSDINPAVELSPAFLAARSAVEVRVSELEAVIVDRDAVNKLVAKLKILRTEDLTCLEPLTDGTGQLTREKLVRALEAYPLVAFAIVEKNLEDIAKRSQAQLEDAKGYAKSIQALKLDTDH